MMKKGLIAFITVCLVSTCCQAETVKLSALDLLKVQQGWGHPQPDHSVDGNPLTIGQTSYEYGLGTHADSVFIINCAGQAQRFTAQVGIDAEVQDNPGSVIFQVIGDGKELYNSGLIKAGQPAQAVDVDLTGIQTMILLVEGGDDGINYDHADWALGQIEYQGTAPVALDAPVEKAVVLTPPTPSEPRINGAAVLGVRPGSPILYTIAATGERPMTFSAENLPEGLQCDEKNGHLTGVLKVPATYTITLKATNAKGTAQRDLRLVVGDTLALTPPMGWNSWNCWGCAVDEEKIRQAAQNMVDSGLVNHGWTYINIDDCWMRKPDDPARDENGMILTNERFPNMKKLTDDIHALGLKVGIYISPGPTTCQGYEGSYQHELQDAIQFAAWGFDYLKYDWCGYSQIEQGRDKAALAKPYALMKQCLDQVDRDIVYSLCQYGMGDVWTWGQEVGGNCWRTTGDITDTWGSVSSIGFSQDKCSPYAGPGHWNDPDMLVVGQVGWGPNLHPTRLTPNEQYTHISLWCLLSAPLLIGCDLSKLDDFTLNLLTNDEVLAINQDPLGRQARRVHLDGRCEVWSKPLADGSLAVGLFNRGEFKQDVAVQWSDLGLTGAARLRDCWRQQDLGTVNERFTRAIPRHGVFLMRVFPNHAKP